MVAQWRHYLVWYSTTYSNTLPLVNTQILFLRFTKELDLQTGVPRFCGTMSSHKGRNERSMSNVGGWQMHADCWVWNVDGRSPTHWAVFYYTCIGYHNIQKVINFRFGKLYCCIFPVNWLIFLRHTGTSLLWTVLSTRCMTDDRRTLSPVSTCWYQRNLNLGIDSWIKSKALTYRA